MDTVTLTLGVKMLDGLAARMAVIAQNVANAGTPGYRPVRLDFENVLAAAHQRRDALGAVDMSELAPTTGAPGTLRMDLELAEAAQTQGRYAAVADLLARQCELQRAAIAGGRP